MVVALAALLLAASAGSAGAHQAKFKSIVEIDAYLVTGAFQGSVGSFDNKRCSGKLLSSRKHKHACCFDRSSTFVVP